MRSVFVYIISEKIYDGKFGRVKFIRPVRKIGT